MPIPERADRIAKKHCAISVGRFATDFLSAAKLARLFASYSGIAASQEVREKQVALCKKGDGHLRGNKEHASAYSIYFRNFHAADCANERTDEQRATPCFENGYE